MSSTIRRVCVFAILAIAGSFATASPASATPTADCSTLQGVFGNPNCDPSDLINKYTTKLNQTVVVIGDAGGAAVTKAGGTAGMAIGASSCGTDAQGCVVPAVYFDFVGWGTLIVATATLIYQIWGNP